MTHGVLTNKFIAEYNYEAIDRDFDIFMVTKESSKLDRTNVLDIPLAEWKARAVQYSFGRNAFVLFTKGSVDIESFRMQIQEQFPEVTVRRIDVLDEERHGCFFHNNRLLAQLLLNSLKMPDNPQLAYQNLTGKLFYTDSAWILKDKQTKRPYMLYALEVHLSPGMYLTLKVKTFRQKTDDRKNNVREYIFDPKTKHLRKRLKEDAKLERIFTEGSFEKKRNTVDYLDYRSIRAFRKCKLGVMQRLLTDIKEKLGDYLTLTPEYKEEVKSFEIPKIQKQALDEKRLASLMKRPIILIDDANTERSAEMIKIITEQLDRYYGLSANIGSWNKQAYHIRLIHEEEYYTQNHLPDPHGNVPEGMIVQHIAEEQELSEGSNKASPALNKILQELLIKEDVLNERVRIFDWKSLGFDRIWTFVMREKIAREDDEERRPHINRAGKQEYDYHFYTAVSIEQDGAMRFSRYRDNSDDLTDEHEKVIRAYDIFDKDQSRVENNVEGLVYSDIGNIHAIIRTPMTTMPAIDVIRSGLEESDPKTLLDREQLLDALEEFAAEHPEEKTRAYADMLRGKLSEHETDIDKAGFKKMMDYAHNRSAAKAWNRFLHGNYGILIMPEFKSVDLEEKYRLENLLDIKYYIETNHEGRPEFRYYVGTKRKMLQTSLHNACIVRKVISSADRIEFEALLPLLAVDFVRNNQYTVLPFPFKFLREYALMENEP